MISSRRCCHRYPPHVLLYHVSPSCMIQHVPFSTTAARRRPHARGPKGIFKRSHLQIMLLFLAFTASLFMFTAHTQSATSSTTVAEQIRYLQATYKGPVQSEYGVSGGYWQLEVNYSTRAVPLFAKTRFRASNKTCWQLASAHQETFSQLYHPTRQQPMVGSSAGFRCNQSP